MRRLTLAEAKSKSRKQKVIGWLIMVLATLLLLNSLIFFLYERMLHIHEITSKYNSIDVINALLFEIVHLLEGFYSAMEFLDVLNLAPQLDTQNLISENTGRFLALIGVLALGDVVRNSGNRLSQRIVKKQEEIEEREWEEEGDSGSPPINTNKPIVISIRREESWYSRPIGIISLAIIAGYAVLLLGKLSGF